MSEVPLYLGHGGSGEGLLGLGGVERGLRVEDQCECECEFESEFECECECGCECECECECECVRVCE